MRIEIEYEASWRNSFLGGGNNEPLPKDGRKYIGSMTSLGKPENFIKREITLDTVMGVLNRLIGDQRKLYQSRLGSEYYFRELEPLVSFNDTPKAINHEMTYIRNISGSTDQNSFTGLVKTHSPMLSSDFSAELWGVLGLSFDELCKFILDDNYSVLSKTALDPLTIVSLAELIDKTNKPVEMSSYYDKIVDVIQKRFPEVITEKQSAPYVEKNGKVKPIRFYAAALYFQVERLKNKYDMTKALTSSGKIAGFSKRGFNGRRDFMKNFVTGGEKKIWGNPYIFEEFVKGEGKTKHLMTKASGVLEIEINVDREKAKEIANLIDFAGVSSFYLGKKGLAYVSKIRV